jgi:1,4-alpha-glucan branching enzyme
VAVSGSFNSWVPQAMTKGKDGLWSVTLQLVPGFYPYRFLVDTERTDDPNNSRKTLDPLQGFCSMCEVL